MSDMEELASKMDQLTHEELQHIAKLACLLRFCPGFKEELEQIIPYDQGAVSPEQLKATYALIDTWLYDKGWAGLLRPELESVGVRV